MKAHGQGEELIQEVFEEVMPAHVGEFVGNGGAEFGVGQCREHVRRQKHKLALDADGDRAVNLCRCAERSGFDAECIRTLRPVVGGMGAESDRGGVAA
jgi:hypothetical protein